MYTSVINMYIVLFNSVTSSENDLSREMNKNVDA